MIPFDQNPLNVAAPEAGVLADLFWIFLAILLLVWVLVLVALLLGLLRRRGERTDPLELDRPTERRFGVIVSSLAGLTGIIVIGLAIFSFSAQGALFGRASAGLEIKVIGHQWWWEVQYQSTDPTQTFTTANEIHVPVGTPVTVTLTSADVIHSFWVPALMGKMDAITGRENRIQFTAVKPGIYRGQCAEFCGLQHAHMALTVYAEDAATYENWRSGQLLAAAPPATCGIL